MTILPVQTSDLISNDEQYFAFPAVSNSFLGERKRAYLGEPEKLPMFEALRFGSLFHKILLEPESFNFREYTGRERMHAMKLQESVERNCPKIWLQGIKEKPFTYDFLGWRCKMKVDLLNEPTKVLTDFKTTSAKSKEEFLGAIIKYDYMRQGAWYLDCPSIVEKEIDTFRIIAICKAEPFDVFYWTMDRNDERLNDGRDDYLTILEYMADDPNFAHYRSDFKIEPKPREPIKVDFSKISFITSTNHSTKMQDNEQTHQIPVDNHTTPEDDNRVANDQQHSNADDAEHSNTNNSRTEGIEGDVSSGEAPVVIAFVEEEIVDPNAPKDEVTDNIQSIESKPREGKLSTRRLTVKLTHDDLDEMSRNLSRQTLEIVALEEEKREQSKYFADKIKRLRKQNNVLATKLENGEEEIDIAVEIFMNKPRLGYKTIVRQDTHESWEEEMTEAEYRLDTLPANVNDGSNDENAEDGDTITGDGTGEALNEFDENNPAVEHTSNEGTTGQDLGAGDDPEVSFENETPGDPLDEYKEIPLPGEKAEGIEEEVEPPFQPITQQ